MFVTADLMLLNKSDLLPHLDFDVGECLANALRINPNLQTLIVSAKTGEGIAAFAAWIEASAARHASAVAKGPDNGNARRARPTDDAAAGARECKGSVFGPLLIALRRVSRWAGSFATTPKAF